MKRALTPTLNPTGIGSAIAAIYAAIVMIWNASHHHAVVDPQAITAALGSAAFLYARFKVTPVGDPKDGNGVPLKAVPLPERPPDVEPAGFAKLPPGYPPSKPPMQSLPPTAADTAAPPVGPLNT